MTNIMVSLRVAFSEGIRILIHELVSCSASNDCTSITH